MNSIRFKGFLKRTPSDVTYFIKRWNIYPVSTISNNNLDWKNEISVNTDLNIEDNTSVDSHIAPYVEPTFNFASYANKSETLQKLVQLGVELNKLEKRKGIPQYLLRLDFERDMKRHITFLADMNLPTESFGKFITKNPFIFKESISDLGKLFYNS